MHISCDFSSFCSLAIEMVGILKDEPWSAACILANQSRIWLFDLNGAWPLNCDESWSTHWTALSNGEPCRKRRSDQNQTEIGLACIRLRTQDGLEESVSESGGILTLHRDGDLP